MGTLKACGMSDIQDLFDLVRGERESRRGSLDYIKDHDLVPGGTQWYKRRREEKKERERELAQPVYRARSQANYYRKHKARLNKARVERMRRPHEAYARAKRKAIGKGQVFQLSMEEWLRVWREAPKAYDPETGFYKDAWLLRGSDYHTSTQMSRKDTSGPWSVENVHITLAGEPLDEEITTT